MWPIDLHAGHQISSRSYACSRSPILSLESPTSTVPSDVVLSPLRMSYRLAMVRSRDYKLRFASQRPVARRAVDACVARSLRVDAPHDGKASCIVGGSYH